MHLLKSNEPLSRHCHYKTGGNALYYAEPCITEELIDLIDFANEKNLEVFVFGKGANILFSDKPFEAVVISTAKLNNYMVLSNDIFYAGAGVNLDDFIRFSILNGYEGAENLSGIPGCIGGNIMMNAGAFGTEMKDVVEKVTVINKQRQIEILDNDSVGFEYRNTLNLKDKIVLSAQIKLNKDKDNTALSKTVVEINGEIINKNSAAYLILKENDSVEFIQFVGGG